MKIIYKPEPKPIENPYRDRLFECNECGIKFLVEDEDIANIVTKSIMNVDRNWYEKNINRYKVVHFLKCECGHLVQLDEIVTSWMHGDVVVGGKPYKEEK